MRLFLLVFVLIPGVILADIRNPQELRSFFDNAYIEGLESFPMPLGTTSTFTQSLGVQPFESNGFTNAVSWGTSSLQDFTVYPLSFAESVVGNDRVRTVRDVNGFVIDCWTNNWDALSWAVDHYGPIGGNPATWLAERDPCRMHLKASVIESWPDYMDWQLAVVSQVSTQLVGNTFPYYDPAWSNEMVILGLDDVGDAWIHCPPDVDEFELFSCSDLCSNDWQTLMRGNVENDPHIISLGYTANKRFYVIGNAGKDSDLDGLPDAEEVLVYKTNPEQPDTDSDGLYDGEELNSGYNPLSQDSNFNGILDSIEYMQAAAPAAEGSAVRISWDAVEYKSWKVDRTKFKGFPAFTPTVPPIYYLSGTWSEIQLSTNEVSATELSTGSIISLGTCNVDGENTSLSGHSSYEQKGYLNGELTSKNSCNISWNNSTATETTHEWIKDVCDDTSSDSYCGFKGGPPVGLPGAVWTTFLIRPYLYWGSAGQQGSGFLTENLYTTNLQILRNKYRKKDLIEWTHSDLGHIQTTYDPGWGTNVVWEDEGEIACTPILPSYNRAPVHSSVFWLAQNEDSLNLTSPAFRFQVNTAANEEYIIYWMEEFIEEMYMQTGRVTRVLSHRFTGTGGQQWVGWPTAPDKFRIKPPTPDLGNGCIKIIPMLADLDIDADNNETINDQDDPLEDRPDHHSKIAMVNDDDSDADGIPDYFDGYGNDATNALSNSCATDGFVEIKLSLPEPIDLGRSCLQFVYDATKPGQTTNNLCIWSVDAPTDRNPISIRDGGHYIDTGRYSDLSVLGFSGSTRSVPFYVEGIKTGSHRIAILLDPDGPGDAKLGEVDAVKITVVNPQLITDRNHDRTIDSDDAALQATPFHFWVNDDKDFGDISTGNAITGTGSDVPGQTDGNHTDGVVNGRCDLTDFFPVWLDLDSTLTLLPVSGGFEYKLSHADSALRYIPTKLSPGQAGAYLTADGSTYGKAANQNAFDAGTIQLTDDGVVLDNTFLNAAGSGGGVLLVEGCSNTSAPLTLEILKSGHVVAECHLSLSISGIEEFYWRVNIRSGEVTTAPANESPECIASTNAFVFVHGYNVSETAARSWNSEFFKRLYWAGSTARFYGMTWLGNDGQKLIPILGDKTPDYNSNAIHALEAAPRLKSFINSIDRDNIVLAGHSLGNMISSEAIRIGAAVDKYFAINAAVAAEAYDSGSYDLNMVHQEWGDPDSSGYEKRLHTAEWHALFDLPDARSELTWDGYFSSVTPVMYNFYSSGEEVLDMHPHANSPGYLDVGIFSGQYAWSLQEKLKGRSWINGIGGSTYGGWGFNGDYNGSNTGGVLNPDTGLYVIAATPAQATAANVTDAMLRAVPFFRKGSAATLPLYNENTGSTFAATNQRELLAGFIPAVSLAAGKAEIPGIATPQKGTCNFDMQDLFETGWPQQRLNDVDWRNKWLHSDLKNVAYLYVNKLYTKIVEMGGMK